MSLNLTLLLRKIIHTLHLFIFILLFIHLTVYGQNVFSRLDTIRVYHDSKKLSFPWLGGLSNPQFSSVDLNNDGIKDLFIFDKEDGKLLTFLNSGMPNAIDLIYNSKYEFNFPLLTQWALLVDFNQDGIDDIFTHEPNTFIKVYKGFYSNNRITFTLENDRLEYQGNSSIQPIQSSSIDLPAILDVNNDGDIDILAFDIFSGVTVTYFENQSQELYGHSDSLFYDDLSPCWGLFKEDGVSNNVFLSACTTGKTGKETLHSGSSMLAYDNDGDGDKDLLLGDLSSGHLTLLINGDDSSHALMVSQDTLFPSNNLQVNIPYMPGAYYLDINNDGLKDMLLAPTLSGSINYNTTWYYENTGTQNSPLFTFKTDSFFTNNMIEVGSGANPTFFDYNTDGLLDIIIGNYKYSDGLGTESSSLALYENIGTPSTPAFNLITRDYAGLGSLGVKGLAPAFADIDNDGDSDMFVGIEDGTILYYQNIGGTFAPVLANYMNLNVGQYATPQIVDVNRDGLLDLLIGERNGNVNYVKNQGTQNNPVFSQDSLIDNFGNVDVRQTGYFTGYSVPFLTTLDSTGGYYLLVGSERGYVYLYGNIDNNLTGSFNLIDSFYSGIDVGNRATPSLADINNDNKLEMIVGNYRGGITIFTATDSIIIIDNIETFSIDNGVNIYPNPNHGAFNIQQNTHKIHFKYLIITDLHGRILLSQEIDDFSSIQSDFSSGIYICKLYNNEIFTTHKIIIY